MSTSPLNLRISQSVGRQGANLPADVLTVQQLINGKIPVPLRPLRVDGICGPATVFAIEELQRRSLGITRPDGRVDPNGITFQFLSGAAISNPLGRKIAWGAKVSPAFKAKVIVIAANVAVDPNYLMAAMAFESGKTFSPSVKNSQSGATGLIQFMPSTATNLGTSISALAAMTAEKQLDYVEKYFNPYKGKLMTIEDVYMAILWPNAIGKPNSYVLFSSPSAAYTQNSGLDANHDGKVTKEEAAARVKALLALGNTAGYLG